MAKRSRISGGIAWTIGGYIGWFLGSNLTDIMVLNNIVVKYIIIAIAAGTFSYITGTLFDRIMKYLYD